MARHAPPETSADTTKYSVNEELIRPMTKSIYIREVHGLRTLCIAGLIAVASSLGAVAADDTRLDDGAKKVGNNFGELLKGMGQEVKKAGGSLSKSDKSDKKKATEASEDEPEKDKEKEKSK